MAALSLGICTTIRPMTNIFRSLKPRISCVWDPEGVFKTPPQTGHLARLEFKKKFDKDDEAKEAYERHLREEKERREAFRESRVVPDTSAGLIEYFLDTEAQEIEYEISRLRPRLDDEFFRDLKSELGLLRFSVTKTQDMEDRMIELEALQKALLEGTEAYDQMQNELIKAKQSLTKIFTSKDIKTTLLEMVEQNELNLSLLTLLDENIASALRSDQVSVNIQNSCLSKQKQAADYMEKIRGAVLKYVTV